MYEINFYYIDEAYCEKRRKCVLIEAKTKKQSIEKFNKWSDNNTFLQNRTIVIDKVKHVEIN